MHGTFQTSMLTRTLTTAYIDKVNLSDSFAKFTDHWSPKVAGSINNFDIKLVKVEGDFVWHHHTVEDELFLVTKGSLLMKFRDPQVCGI